MPLISAAAMAPLGALLLLHCHEAEPIALRPAPPETVAPFKLRPAKITPPAEPAKAEPKDSDTAVAFPHPIITEILYAVPHGVEGDASRDGKRQDTGDEFIELTNPHDKPIWLTGYTIRDRNPANVGPLLFRFPEFQLAPNRRVVVFNGNGVDWEGPVGDTHRAPPGPHGNFAEAHVFTMRAGSRYVAWGNGGDYALLSDPAGEPVQCVWWGEFEEELPEAPLVEEVPPTEDESAERDGPDGQFARSARFQRHRQIKGAQGVPFSPGTGPAGGERPAEDQPNP